MKLYRYLVSEYANGFGNYWKSKDYDYTVYSCGEAKESCWNDVYSAIWPGDVVQYGHTVNSFHDVAGFYMYYSCTRI